jgi:DNA-binding transcriptional ArsR family regulator
VNLTSDSLLSVGEAVATGDGADADMFTAALDNTSLSVEDVAEAVGDPSRRQVLHLLGDSEFMLALADIAREVAAPDGEPSPTLTADDLRRAKIRLHHCHLPKLADAGLVNYDVRSRMVALAPAGERVLDATQSTATA